MALQSCSEAPNINPLATNGLKEISIREMGDVTNPFMGQMTTRETCNYLKKILRDAYGGDHRYKEEMESIRGVLYTRAWIITIIFVIFRVLVVISGNSDWQTDY